MPRSELSNRARVTPNEQWIILLLIIIWSCRTRSFYLPPSDVLSSFSCNKVGIGQLMSDWFTNCFGRLFPLQFFSTAGCEWFFWSIPCAERHVVLYVTDTDQQTHGIRQNNTRQRHRNEHEHNSKRINIEILYNLTTYIEIHELKTKEKLETWDK